MLGPQKERNISARTGSSSAALAGAGFRVTARAFDLDHGSAGDDDEATFSRAATRQRLTTRCLRLIDLNLC